MSNAKIGRAPWNKGKKGCFNNPIKGKKNVWSPNTLKKMSNAKIGKVSTFKGKHHTPETRKKLSEALKGKPATRLIKTISPEIRLKISNSVKNLPPQSEITRERRRQSIKMRYDKLGRITILRKSVRRMAQYKVWQKQIFIRDDYTCQLCHKRGGYIHAHHKIKFAHILRLYNIKDADDAYNCKLLWDINNGVTYCKECHKKVELSYRNCPSSN